MNAHTEEQELKDRLDLIENMISQGRRTIESWGWTFVLWGVAYYVAIAWSAWGRAGVAWPVTMIAAGALTGIVASRMTHNKPGTTFGRALGSIWISFGISIFLLMMSLGISGKLESHASVAIVSAMLGMGNAASSMILKWKLQFACAVVWWATAVSACFTSDTQTSIVFLVAIFLCLIVFGIYCMIREAQLRKQAGASNA